MKVSYTLLANGLILSIVQMATSVCRAADPSVHELVEGNASAIAQYRLLDMTFKVGQSHDPSQADNDRVAFTKCRWTADVLADQERFRFIVGTMIRPDIANHRQGNYEVSKRGDEYRVLMAWDWDKPEKLTPFEQRGVRAWIDPTFGREPMFRYLRPTEHLMWEFTLPMSGNQRVSLRELFKMSKDATVAGTTVVNGRSVWKVVTRDIPGALSAYVSDSKDEPKNVSVDIEVDIDTATLNVVRFVQKYGNLVAKYPSGETRRISAEWAVAVTDFKECPAGILVPWISEHSSVADGKEQVSITKVATALVNEPLAADALTFQFPEFARVEHRPGINGNMKVELWGADDRPLKQIKDEMEDLREYMSWAPRWPDKRPASILDYLFWIVVFSFIGTSGWLLYRRYSNHSS